MRPALRKAFVLGVASTSVCGGAIRAVVFYRLY